MLPIAAGAALAGKLMNDGSVAVVFLGDGALGEGLVYETLNIASKWCLPLLIVIENNHYAQSTSSSQTLAGSVSDRAKGFGFDYVHGDTWQWEALLGTARECVSTVRTQGCPIVLEVETYRLKAHSKGDDNRQRDEVAAYWAKDPLNRLLVDDSDGSIAALDEDVAREITAAVASAEHAPRCIVAATSADPASAPMVWDPPTFSEQRVTDAIHAALRRHLSANGARCCSARTLKAATAVRSRSHAT